MNTAFLYVSIADKIRQLIDSQVIRVGDKLPSVRRLSEEHGVSLTTAFQAYYHLEAQGWIEARPKSGYYVRYNPTKSYALPSASQPDAIVQTLSNDELLTRLYNQPDGPLRFAAAVPAPDLLPVAKLQKAMIHALRTAPAGGTTYEDGKGNAELRQQIARLAFGSGSVVTPDEVIITAGCMEAVVLCLQSVTRPGDTIAVESPSYFAFFQAFEKMGLNVLELPANPTTGVDLDALETALQAGVVQACLLTPTFSNPLGSCLMNTDRQRLVQMMARYQTPLIEDDVYGDLYFGKTRPRTCHSYDTEGWIMLCSSFSKSLAPGYRIGWVLPGRFGLAINRQKAVFSRTCPTLTQAALAHFLAHGRYDHHLRQLRQTFHLTSLRYQQAISAYFPEGTRFTNPEGGFVLWVELPDLIDTVQISQQALLEGISVTPGAVFTAQQLYQNCLRISFGQPFSPAVEDGLKRLGKLASR
jgi:DNA-binding transcriptional MocR family regulator